MLPFNISADQQFGSITWIFELYNKLQEMISLYTRWNVTVCQVRSATLLQITSSDYIMLILIHWPHAHDACQLAYFNQILEFLVSMLNRTQLPDPNIFLRDRFLPRPSSYSKPNTYSYQPSIAVKFPTNECKI